MKDLTRNPKYIAVTWHPLLPKAKLEACKVFEALQNAGLERLELYSLNDRLFRQSVKTTQYDVVITLGGDGTMIRTGKLCAPMGIPVMGINMGSFGFLIETQLDQWPAQIPALLDGKWKYEERMMLHAELLVEGKETRSWEVLNDATIARGASLRPIRLSVKIGGSPLTNYVADGLIVASATGSTAYSMAVGGPVMQPELRNMLVIPIAPHLCFDRALILQEGEVVEIIVTGSTESVLSPDGYESIPLHQGDRIMVSASAYNARFVRFSDIGFFYQNFIQYMQRNPSAGGNIS